MGLTDMLRDALALPYLAHTGGNAVALESPWASPNHLVSITPPGAGLASVSRQTAMSVPAIKRARNILVGSIARCPLEARENGRRAENQPIWLNRTDGVQYPFFRMSWTIDDLLNRLVFCAAAILPRFQGRSEEQTSDLPSRFDI